MIAPTLETPRLILRALSPDDWEAYAEAWADPRMTRFIGGQPRDRPTSWGKFLQAAGLWSILGYGYWSFIERETGRLAGNGGLAQFERGVAALAGHAEAGWAFVPDAWGKGYATEAMSAILDWADRGPRLAEIRAIIDADNLASNRVAEKCGFVRAIASLPEMPGTALWTRAARPSAAA